MVTTSLNFSQLAPKTYKLLLEEKSGILLDTRTPAEYAENHISKAINIDFYAVDFEDQLEQLDKAAPYFIYCRTGSRTKVTLEIMKKMGFREVYDLQGGILAWEVANMGLS